MATAALPPGSLVPVLGGRCWEYTECILYGGDNFWVSLLRKSAPQQRQHIRRGMHVNLARNFRTHLGARVGEEGGGQLRSNVAGHVIKERGHSKPNPCRLVRRKLQPKPVQRGMLTREFSYPRTGLLPSTSASSHK